MHHTYKAFWVTLGVSNISSFFLISRHSIYAPSLHNSYASATFPGLHDSLVDAPRTGDWTLVKEQLSNVIVAIEWAAKFLESAI